MTKELHSELHGVAKESYGAHYSDHLLDQYRLYVEMADRISGRRQSANSFFLAINTALVAMLGIGWPRTVGLVSLLWYSIVSVAGITLCFSWHRLICSYRQLNSGKFKVMHAMEQHLPLRPYDAEWSSLGRGEKPELYFPFTHIETRIPWAFLGLYVALILVALVAHCYGHRFNQI